jgi:hypothetical protein
MTTCKAISKDMLINPTALHVEEDHLDFARARQIADLKAKELSQDPMLMAWYENSSGSFSPNVECCSEHKPGWVVYAESRGGHITIDINDETYIFIYREALS